MSSQPVPRSTRSGQLPIPSRSLSDVRTTGPGLPNRYILHAVEKWGKTSLAAKFPKPIFIQTQGETGLESLIDAGRIGAIPHFPECDTWGDVLSSVNALRTSEHEYRTLVIDTLNGAERQCHEHVCARDFDGDWGEKGFTGYQRGPEIAIADWIQLLTDLDRLRVERRMTVVAICHTKIKNFKNPEGPDYERYQPDMNDKTWGKSHKWADIILFGNYETSTMAVKTDKKTGAQKGKGVGGQRRVIYTERTAAYDAGNRIGLPPEIDGGESADEAWKNLSTAIITARKATEGTQSNG